MSRIRFLPPALDDLDEIRAKVGQENPHAADALVDRLVDSVLILIEHPRAGEARPELGRDVRRVVEAPYLLFYRVTDDEVEVIRVLHGARRITRRMMRGN